MQRLSFRSACLVALVAALVAAAAWTPPAAHALSFNPPADYAAGNSPVSLATGDFNGDSDPDLVVTNEFSNDVSILLGGSGDSFSAPTNYPVGVGPQDVVVDDFNGDSDPDLAVVNEFSYDVSILLGDTGSTFVASGNFPVGTRPLGIASGDFNGDSDPDLVAVNESDNTISILLGGAGATFTGPTNIAVGSTPQAVAVGEFNGDSDPDLAVANGGTDSVSILLGAAGSSFGAAGNVAAGNFPIAVAVGDFNGDSDPDLAVANDLSNDLSVLLGGAGGSFSAAVNYATGAAPQSVAAGEFTGDSDPDLAVANELSHDISVLVGQAGGTFSASTSYASGNLPAWVATGRFDGDAYDDLAIAHQGSSHISIMTRAVDTTPPETTITSGPPPLSNDPTPTFTFSSSESPSAFQCRVDSAAFAPCSSPHTTTTLSNGSRTFQVRATDDSGNTDPTAASQSFAIDTAAPAAPSLTATDPASPANQNNPKLKGSAEASSTVTLYSAASAADCLPQNALASGPAASLASPGIAVAVADDSTTTLRATATDQAGNVSGCSSSSVSYVEDSTAPAAPAVTATDPASPANQNNPKLKGSAEASSTVTLYSAASAADCLPQNALASGPAASLASPGIAVAVADDSTTTLRATATDQAGNVSGCSSSSVSYVEDSTAPAAPAVTATDPASPANQNNPKLKGSAEAGSTVTLYRAALAADCTPANAVATGAAATFTVGGIAAGVPDDSTTPFRATATDPAGNVSGCSPSPLSYVEDSTSPAAPTLGATDPASPANENNPKVLGSAETGSTVTLYSAASAADCLPQDALASGPAASLASPGIAVAVADNSITTLRATATDQAGNVSACSAGSLAYEESSPPDTGTPPDPGIPPGGGGSGGGSSAGGDSSAGAGAGSGAPPADATSDLTAPLMALAAKTLKLGSSGTVAVPLGCPASESGGCRGTLRLEAVLPATASDAAAGRDAARRRRVTLGRASFRIAGGRRATIQIRLSRKSRRLVEKVRKLSVLAIVQSRDQAGNARTARRKLALRLAKPAARAKRR